MRRPILNRNTDVGAANHRIHRSALLVVLASLLVISPAQAEELRTWKDASGKFEMKAKFVKELEGKVYLQDEAGKEFAIPKARLSKADLDYLTGNVEQDPFQELKPAKKVPTSLLTVGYQLGSREVLTPGVVCSVHDGQAYVMAMIQFSQQQVPGAPASMVPEKFIAVLNQEGEQRKVALELVAVDAEKFKYILRGPAKDLPQPLVSNEAAPKVTEKQLCQIVGLRSDNHRNAIADIQSPATVSELFRSLDGSLNQFVLEPSSSFTCYWGVVLNDQGQQIGLIASRLGYVDQRVPGIVASPVEMAKYWESPSIIKMYLFPVSGNVKTIQWEVLVEYSDPFKKMNRPLFICRLESTRSSRPQPGQPTAPTPKLDAPFDESATRIELKGEKPSTLFQSFLEKTNPRPLGDVFVGRFEIPNPGQIGSEYHFQCQVAYDLAGKQDTTWMPVQRVVFRTHGLRSATGGPVILQYSNDVSVPGEAQKAIAEKPAPVVPTQFHGVKVTLPNIPGLNGRPLDVPQAVEVESGYLLTNEVTLVDPPREGKVPKKPPQPNIERRDIAGEPHHNGPFTFWSLDIKPNVTARPSPTSAVMTVSSDGKAIYLVDAEHVLYRINAESLEITTTLKFDSRPGAMVYSRHGLIVSLPEKKVLWQLDATALEVEREFEIFGVKQLTASPGSDLCFITLPPVNGGSGEVALGLLDLAQGRLLHVIENQYKSGVFSTPLGAPVSIHGDIWIKITSDGQYLMMSGNTFRRFRIRGKDLILQEVRGPGSGTCEGPFALSGDGSFVAFPVNRLEALKGYGTLNLYDGMNLTARPTAPMRVANPIAIAFADDSKSVYCVEGGRQGSSLLHQYLIDGEKNFSLVLEDTDVRQIYILDGGKRILANGGNAFIVYEIPIDTFKKRPKATGTKDAPAKEPAGAEQ